MKLIGVHLSPYARKVAVILTVKGLAYEQEPMLPGSGGPEFRKISPLGKIPVLMDGESAIPDSSVICEYLEEKYPEIPVLPDTPELRAINAASPYNRRSKFHAVIPDDQDCSHARSAFAHGRPPRGDRLHRTVQYVLRQSTRWRIYTPHRRYGSGPQYAGV